MAGTQSISYIFNCSFLNWNWLLVKMYMCLSSSKPAWHFTFFKQMLHNVTQAGVNTATEFPRRERNKSAVLFIEEHFHFNSGYTDATCFGLFIACVIFIKNIKYHQMSFKGVVFGDRFNISLPFFLQWCKCCNVLHRP